MDKKSFMLTIRLPFEAMDTIEARQIAKEMMTDLQLSEEEKKVVKLQQVFPNKAPEGIEL